jgi:hypothetical protein
LPVPASADHLHPVAAGDRGVHRCALLTGHLALARGQRPLKRLLIDAANPFPGAALRRGDQAPLHPDQLGGRHLPSLRCKHVAAACEARGAIAQLRDRGPLPVAWACARSTARSSNVLSFSVNPSAPANASASSRRRVGCANSVASAAAVVLAWSSPSRR